MIKIREISAVIGMAIAVGAVVFMQSLVTTNDAQAERRAAAMLAAVPVEEGASVGNFQLDFRPDGRVLQGPPMMAVVATQSDGKGAPSPMSLRLNECLVTKALFAQRKVRTVPAVGEELTLIGRKGAYRVKIAGYLDWERPARGYPNLLVTPETAEAINEEWRPWEPKTAVELAPMFRSDVGRHLDRAKPLLLWAAALTALCLLLNSLFLSLEARRRDIATLRMIGLTRGGVIRMVLKESFVLTLIGAVVGIGLAVAALGGYVSVEVETFPCGMSVGWQGVVGVLLTTPLVALCGVLLALRKALSVKPLEAAANHPPKRKHLGMLIAFACGFGAFVAVEVWGSSLTKPFIPSLEWPDAIVSVLPAGVSSFDIEKLQHLPGVRKIAELQPLQVRLAGGEPAQEEPKKGEQAGPGRGRNFPNVLLLASDWLPSFRFVDPKASEPDFYARISDLLAAGDHCLITAMMARAKKLAVGDMLKLDAGRGLEIGLKIVGIVDLNWHMVTSRGLLRGMNRMPVNTDGPVFVSFDTLAACDSRPQEFVKMTHLWLDYEPEFLEKHGVFPAGRLVEQEILEALGGAFDEDGEGEVRGNAVRLHSRDEVSDGTLAHGVELVGAMARVPFIFLAVLSLGFIAMLVASADARKREFRVMRAVGATRRQLAAVLVKEALKVAFVGMAIGLAGGALIGWLSTAGTRAAMSNWGLPATFALPLWTVLKGALGAILFTLAVSIPTALRIVRTHR